jgi:hypothetical protein
MAILEQTSTKLKLQFRPWYIWIFGLLSPVFTLYIFSVIVQTNSFTCQRREPNQGNCQLVTTYFILSNTKNIPLSELQGARFDQEPNNDGSQNQQVVLLTKKGEIPFGFTRNYHPKTVTELNSIAERINEFVNNPQQPSLHLQQGIPAFGWVFSAVTGVNLLWTLFCSDVTTCDFDKTRGSLIKKRQWFWFITRTVEYPLSEITEIKVEEEWNRGKKRRVTLVLNADKSLPLTGYATSYYQSKAKIEATVETIKQFLK